MPSFNTSPRPSHSGTKSRRTILRAGGGLLVRIQDLRAGFKADTLLKSFSFAFQGFLYAAQTQRNFRIHLVLGAIALVLAWVLQLSVFEFALIVGVIGLVLFAELVNTAIELLVDMMTQGRYDIQAKAVKDMAAGAVMVTSIAAFICGLCVYMPKFWLFLHRVSP